MDWNIIWQKDEQKDAVVINLNCAFWIFIDICLEKLFYLNNIRSIIVWYLKKVYENEYPGLILRWPKFNRISNQMQWNISKLVVKWQWIL